MLIEAAGRCNSGDIRPATMAVLDKTEQVMIRGFGQYNHGPAGLRLLTLEAEKTCFQILVSSTHF